MGTRKVKLRAVQKTEAWRVKSQRDLEDSIRVVPVLLSIKSMCIRSAGAEKSVVIKKRDQYLWGHLLEALLRVSPQTLCAEGAEAAAEAAAGLSNV